MKALVCEMCGSQDLVKQDGMYICQNCGTKYAPEEAKKLMVEVTIDNSEKIKNLYQLARRAYSDKNYEDAANYYSQITVAVPNDWEAYYFSVFCKQMTCTIANIPLAATSISNCLETTSVLVLNDKNRITDKDEIEGAFVKIYESIDVFCAMILYAAADAYMKPTLDKENLRKCIRAAELLRMKGVEITDFGIHGKNTESYCIAAKKAIESNNTYRSLGGVFTEEELEYIRSRVKEINPNYDLSADSSSEKSGGGCYVATAVYGSYDCPQVWTLRRYRDYTLAETWYGRAFVHTYYAVSPTLVKWFGETAWFKNMWRPKLDKMVKELNEKGVADTPYHDRIW